MDEKKLLIMPMSDRGVTFCPGGCSHAKIMCQAHLIAHGLNCHVATAPEQARRIGLTGFFLQQGLKRYGSSICTLNLFSAFERAAAKAFRVPYCQAKVEIQVLQKCIDDGTCGYFDPDSFDLRKDMIPTAHVRVPQRGALAPALQYCLEDKTVIGFFSATAMNKQSVEGTLLRNMIAGAVFATLKKPGFSEFFAPL